MWEPRGVFPATGVWSGSCRRESIPLAIIDFSWVAVLEASSSILIDCETFAVCPCCQVTCVLPHLVRYVLMDACSTSVESNVDCSLPSIF